MIFRKGVSVTRFIESVKQPRGGFLKPGDFAITKYDDGKTLNPNENIIPQLVGMAVDYLSRFMMTGDAVESFDISIKGATAVRKLKQALKLVDEINGLDDKSIIAACELVKFDVAFRAGPARYTPYDKSLPDKSTIENIRILVERTVTFLKTRKNLEMHVTFRGGYSDIISTGDADFADDIAIWDLKVSNKRPTSKQVLQVIIYQILYNRADKDRQLTSAGIFNPRFNCSYLYDLNDMNVIHYRTIEGMVEYGKDYVHEETYGIDDVATLLRVYYKKEGEGSSLDLDGFVGLMENVVKELLDSDKIQHNMALVAVDNIVNDLPEGKVISGYPIELTGENARCISKYLWTINGDYFVDYGYFEKLISTFKVKRVQINCNFQPILATKKFLMD